MPVAGIVRENIISLFFKCFFIMKTTIQKFLLSLFLILEFGSMVAFSSVPEKPMINTSDNGKFFKPKITFSCIIARRRDCEGFGICNPLFSVSGKISNSLSGYLTTDDFNRNALVLEVNKSTGISAASYDKYFATGTFLLEDDSPIPQEMLQGLSIIGPKTFMAGKYLVKELNGILYISISIK
jgi:hypothetical protein